MREAVRHPAPERRRPARVAVEPSAARWAALDTEASRSRWIEMFYIAEAKAQLDRQRSARPVRRLTVLGHGRSTDGRPERLVS